MNGGCQELGGGKIGELLFKGYRVLQDEERSGEWVCTNMGVLNISDPDT